MYLLFIYSQNKQVIHRMSHKCEKEKKAIVQSPESNTENKRKEKPRCHMGTGQRGNLGKQRTESKQDTNRTTNESHVQHNKETRQAPKAHYGHVGA